MFVSAFCIMLCISSSFSEPVDPITHSPGIYFDPTTEAYFYNDYWSVITHIEFIPIKPYLDKIAHSLSDVFDTCNKFQKQSSFHIDCNDTVNPLEILIGANKLKYGSLSHLVSANDPYYKQTKRSKRGLINVGGKVLNFLFGTLDSDDAKKYDEAFAAVAEDEQQMYSYMQQNIHVVRSTINAFNETITKLNDNEKRINKQLKRLNDRFENLTKANNDLKNGAKINSIFNLIEGSLMSVSNILDTVLNSILFAKTNILHPYVLTPSHLYEELLKAQISQGDLRFPVGLTLQTIHIIMDLSKLTAYYYDNKIVFVMQIPLISSVKYNIYKNLPLPTPRLQTVDSNLKSYVLIHPTKLYTAITDDKLEYALLDSVDDCQDVNGEYKICPLPSILSTMNNPTCETKLMTEVTQALPKMCQSRVIYGNINLWQKLIDGKYIYVQSKPNKLSIKCSDNTQTKDYTIQGTGILTLGEDCVAFFQTLQFKPSVTYMTTLPSQMNIDFNIIEDNCCKFKLVNTSTNMLAPITLNDVNLESLNLESAKLDQMEQNMKQQAHVDIMPHIVKYGDYYSAFTIVAIAVFVCFIVYTVAVKCRNSSNPIILHQRLP